MKGDVKTKSLSVNFSKDITNQQKNIQVNKKVDVEESEPSESNVSQSLKKKKENGEGQVMKRKSKKGNWGPQWKKSRKTYH
ncbi:hypothetical protein GO684_02920 [Wolbachia endosymbiont of Litomosoides brasiliensis]|nr:hypothetical protein [Wolbachia endosymbiont of Litomosoides brasiliensis]